MTLPLSVWLDRALIKDAGRHKASRPRRDVSAATRAEVRASAGDRCTYCGVGFVEQRGHPASYNCDHVVPVSKGGTNDRANLTAACRACNSSKRARSVEAWRRETGRAA